MNGSDIINEVHSFLPPQAQLLYSDSSAQYPIMLAGDLDGDGLEEVAAAYQLNENLYILILKKSPRGWRMVTHMKGQGYDISTFQMAPVVTRKRMDLIVGWQQGSIWSSLSVYHWNGRQMKDVAPQGMFFTYIDVEDMPSPQGKDGLAEIALWVHDTGEAYKVSVYRWTQGHFVMADDVKPYYFQKVVRYYLALVKENPTFPFYWYYLADAQWKAGMKTEALDSIEKGLTLNPTYPPKEEWFKLRQQIMASFGNRHAVSLHPASVKTIHGVKWGYINDQGTFVIPPQYDYANSYQANGLAVVEQNQRSGLINQSGSFVVPPKFSTITGFSEGRAQVLDDQGFRVIDEQGKVLTHKAYDFIAEYKEGRALFTAMVDGKQKYGYLDRGGNEVIAPRFKLGGDFHEGKAVVQVEENTYSLIGLQGQSLRTYKKAYVGSYQDGLMAFKNTSDGKFGYMDMDGNVVIEPQFTDAQAFQNGRAIVNMATDYSYSAYGMIDKAGRFIIQPQYHDLEFLGEGRVAIGKVIDPERPYLGSRYAMADENGRFLSDYNYYHVGPFEQGLASVYDQNSTYFLDRSGNKAAGYPVVPGQGTLTLEGTLVQAFVDQRTSYYSRNGRLVYTQNTVIPLREPYQIKEYKYAPNRDYFLYYPQIEGMANKAAQEKVNRRLKELSQVKPIPPADQLEYSYSGDFSVEFYQGHLVELKLTGYNYPFGAAHGMPTQIFVPVDLQSGKIYKLEDLFLPHSPYVQVLSDKIGEQIKNNEEYSYVFPDTYKGIKADQPFYVQSDALYLYFEPYEIAPFAAGFPTFRIPFSELDSLINKNGEFWRSFHEGGR